MIFCTNDTPYKHKVRVKYRRRIGGREEWYCPDCGEVYTLETDAIRESAPKTTTAITSIEVRQLPMAGL